VEALEHEAELLVADLRHRAVGEAGDRDAVELDRAGGRPIEEADEVHHRRLPGAGGAHHRDVLAGGDVERDVVERPQLGVAGHVHAADAVERHDRRLPFGHDPPHCAGAYAARGENLARGATAGS
jgi:hypothetical protein